jgi:hypothetical protein
MVRTANKPVVLHAAEPRTDEIPYSVGLAVAKPIPPMDYGQAKMK